MSSGVYHSVIDFESRFKSNISHVTTLSSNQHPSEKGIMFLFYSGNVVESWIKYYCS